MNFIQNNDPELENLLMILVEHPSEKENLIPHILKKLPWGYNPAQIIEKIHDPQKRIVIRDAVSEGLIFEKLKYDLIQILPEYKSGDFLLKAAFILSFISSDTYFSYEDLIQDISQLSETLKNRLDASENVSEQNKIKIFIQYFFKELNFTGNKENLNETENHLIGDVIKTKKGGAIVLCILANHIAAGAGIELPIVITAGHFLLRPKIDHILPFIDPYENGKIISEQEHMYNVAEKGYDPSIGLLQITSPLILIQRLVRNLAQSLNKIRTQDELLKIKEVQEIIKEFIKKNP